MKVLKEKKRHEKLQIFIGVQQVRRATGSWQAPLELVLRTKSWEEQTKS